MSNRFEVIINNNNSVYFTYDNISDLCEQIYDYVCSIDGADWDYGFSLSTLDDIYSFLSDYGYGYSYVILLQNNEAAYDTEGEGYYSIGANF